MSVLSTTFFQDKILHLIMLVKTIHHVSKGLVSLSVLYENETDNMKYYFHVHICLQVEYVFKFMIPDVNEIDILVLSVVLVVVDDGGVGNTVKLPV